MVLGQTVRLMATMLVITPMLTACGQQGGSDNETAKPQGVLSAPVSGGRNPAASLAAPAVQPVDFGDDSSQFAKDGECDDKRFSGTGMTSTPLLDSDVAHDATDCRTAFNQSRLTLATAVPASSGSDAANGVNRIQWGDDASKYAKDGECDDKRFTGAGLTDTPLLDSDIKHDATDCRMAYTQGRLTLRE